MPNEFEFQIKGYGSDRASARDDAEKRLPYPVNEIERYKHLVVGDTVQVEGGLWEISVQYSLREQLNKSGSSSPRKGKALPVRGTGLAPLPYSVQLVRKLRR